MRFLSDTFDEYFEYKRDSMLHVMGLLLLSLFILSASVHILLNTVFAGSISTLAQWKVFGPEYLTLIVSYILLRTRRLQLATHVLLGMVITQMLVIFFISGPMSYIYVSYTNVVLIAGLILGPTSATLYTALITGLMYLYFRAIKTNQLDMLYSQNSLMVTEMEMVATQACFIFTGQPSPISL